MRLLNATTVLAEGLASSMFVVPSRPCNGTVAEAVPPHGCWSDVSQSGRVVVMDVDAVTPVWHQRCSMVQRVLAQQVAGAVGVIFYRRNESLGGDISIIPGYQLYGTPYELTVPSTYVNASMNIQQQTWLRMEIEEGDDTLAIELTTALAIIMAVLCLFYILCGVAAFIFLAKRLRMLKIYRPERHWTRSLVSNQSSRLLNLVWLTAFFRVATLPPSFGWLAPNVSWPAFVFLSDLPDILFFATTVKYLLAWSHVAAFLDSRTRVLYKRLKRAVRVAIVVYTLATVASLVCYTYVSASLVWFRLAVLFVGWLFIIVELCVSGHAILRTLRPSHRANASIRSFFYRFVVVFSFTCFFLGVNFTLLVILETVDLSVLAMAGAALGIALSDIGIFALIVGFLWDSYRVREATALSSSASASSDHSADVSTVTSPRSRRSTPTEERRVSRKKSFEQRQKEESERNARISGSPLAVASAVTQCEDGVLSSSYESIDIVSDSYELPQ